MTKPSRAQVRRLREVYRSAGWPWQDTLELELLAAGWLERVSDGPHERVRLTEEGVQAAVQGVAANRAARSAHQDLVLRVATELQRAGRVVWTNLSLRAGLPTVDQPTASDPIQQVADGLGGLDGSLPPQKVRQRWALCEPDVFSLRVTSKPSALAVAIHEVKVSRADLLSELRKPSKSAAYAALSGQTWFVMPAGLADLAEIPDPYGVWWAHEKHFELARSAPQRPHQPEFATWMALARAQPLRSALDGPQESLAPSDLAD